MSGEQRLWVEKYRPLTIADAKSAPGIHKDTYDMVQKLAQSDDFPHILFYGPSGAGKRTLTKCLLQELYGTPMVHKIKSEHKEFKDGSSVVECVVFSSNFHLEVTPSDADNKDRVIVQKLIKEVAGTQQFNTQVQKSFKVVVIHELDNLTREAQAALRRTMETYMPYCRIVANCESLSKVIMPLRSRCLQVRVPAPSSIEVTEVLNGISKREGFNLPRPLAQSICNFSKRNLRRAIMMLQTAKLKNETLSDKTYVPAPEYETYTREIAKAVVQEQSPKQLRQIRTKVYELLTKGITADMIFGILSREFLRKPSGNEGKGGSAALPEAIKPEVLKFAVMFEHRCKEGSKAIFHLEAFLARVMALYKGYQIKVMGR